MKATMAIHTTRTKCRACERPALEPVLDLGVHYLPRWVKDKDPELPKAPLRLVRCTTCGLLQLADTVNADLLYREFWYRSSINQSMRDALKDIVMTGQYWHTRGRWLDIGANDGYLLSLVSESYHKTACEPAENFKAQLEEQADRVVSDYFNAEDYEPGTFDIITSVAMFYDLDNPAAFVEGIANLLAPEGVWINQLNDSPTMMRQNAFDAICHEHLCYYDVPTLNALYRRFGLQIKAITFNDVNGGSIRVVAGHMGRSGADTLGIPAVTPNEVVAFARRTHKWRETMGELLGYWTTREPLWGYGASTKGSTLLQYLDVGAQQMLAIADRNPLKVGLQMAGTWIPVTDEATLRREHPKIVMMLPWAFRNEFVEREVGLRALGSSLLFPLPHPELVL